MTNLLTARRLALLTLLGAAAVACGDNSETQGDRDPTAVIDAPLESETWAAGDLIEFSGHATDPEDGTLSGASLTWWAELHHDTHSHPFMAVQSGASGSVTLPTTGETSDNVWYRFYLRAVDAAGQTDTVSVEIFPRKASLTVTASGTGRQITLDAQPHDAPYTVLSVVGMERAIGAPSPQVALDSTWSFGNWSDGGAQSHAIVMPELDTAFTATFTGTGPGNAPPAVTLTGPAADTTVTASTAVNLLATATDADGTVLAVDFRDGTTVIGTDSTSPYAFGWTPTLTGAHTITARATDDDGSSTISGSRTITVTGGSGSDTELPTIAWTAPAERAPNLTGAVNLTANATDNVGVVGVEFRIDGLSLGEDLSAPYSFSLPATSAYTTGSHFFQARARDAAGNVSAWAVRHVTFGGAEDVPDGVTRTTIANGLSDRGTAMALAPDGRIFVCQQNGQLRVVKNGALLATPFVSLTVNSVFERGLLGVAFDPGYASNRYIYVYYTTSTAPIHNRVSRFTASAGNPDVAEAGSELPMLDLPQLSAGNHNGGAIHFGADGKLYVAVGDNAVGANSQSLTTRLGKMLRINPVDGSIPTDNPFYGTATGDNRAIWALGLRNPFTFAFQPGSGRMHINDVGEGTWEEINLGQAGKNYGWPLEEGRETNPTHEPPLFTYRHPPDGSDNPSMMTGFVITGGAFYNPATVMFPAHYVGSYFFADLESHWIGRLDLTSNEAHHFARNSETVDLLVGTDGALYSLSNTGPSWGIFRYAF